jgi:hypothetical protein
MHKVLRGERLLPLIRTGWRVISVNKHNALTVMRARAGSLIDRMGTVELPWVFDENDRPPLLE